MLIVIAAIAGFLFPQAGWLAKDYMIVPLSLSVFFSLAAAGGDFGLGLGQMRKGLLYNYIVLPAVGLCFAFFMPPGLRDGIIIYTIFPPAVGILTLSAQWGGKVMDVFAFQLASYLASVVLVPMAAHFLIGGPVNPLVFAPYIIFSFLAPAAASKFVKISDRGIARDLSGIFLAAVFYLLMAKNQQWLEANWQAAAVYIVPLTLAYSIVGYAVLAKTRDPDSMLYSIWKNGGAAAAAAIAAGMPEATTAIIAAKSLADVPMIVGLGAAVERMKKAKI